jgi:hypothetical protein
MTERPDDGITYRAGVHYAADYDPDHYDIRGVIERPTT